MLLPPKKGGHWAGSQIPSRLSILYRIEKTNKNQFFFLASTCHCFLGSFLNGHPQLGSPQA